MVDVGATGVKVAWKTLVIVPWIVASGSAGRGCECVVAGVWWRGNGAEALADWIVRNTVEGVLRAR